MVKKVIVVGCGGPHLEEIPPAWRQEVEINHSSRVIDDALGIAGMYRNVEAVAKEAFLENEAFSAKIMSVICNDALTAMEKVLAVFLIGRWVERETRMREVYFDE